MTEELTGAITALAEKAKKAVAGDALHYSQAALNLAHAGQVVAQTEQSKKD